MDFCHGVVIFSLTLGDYDPDQSQERNLYAYCALEHPVHVPNLTTTLKGSTAHYLKRAHQDSVCVAHLGSVGSSSPHLYQINRDDSKARNSDISNVNRQIGTLLNDRRRSPDPAFLTFRQGVRDNRGIQHELVAE